MFEVEARQGPAFPQLVLTDEAPGSGAAFLPALSPNHRPLSSLGTAGEIMGAASASLMSSGSGRAIMKKERLSVWLLLLWFRWRDPVSPE